MDNQDNLQQSIDQITQSNTNTIETPAQNPFTPNATTDAPAQEPPKPNRLRPTTAGAIGAIAGLAVGAAAIFGIMKLTEAAPNCPECNCPSNTNTHASTNDVSYSFLQLEADSKNLIYSPLSIRNGLALLSAGASGTTKTEIDAVLGDATIPQYQNIADKLSLANGVFIRDTFQSKVLPSYTATVQQDYDGEVLYDSFTSSTNMDNWVSQKTFGLIDSIGIDPNPDLRMVLANALAIQMDWKYRFDEDDTGGRTFYQQDGSEITATTMTKKTSADGIKYYTDSEVSAISMPLDSTSEDANLEFVAIMPANDLGEYINQVNQSKVDTIINNLTPASTPKDGVIVHIPKFKFDYQLKFKDDLMSLGVKSAFDQNLADFSNMASDPLYVSSAIHKANIDFSEDGIKAAAITVFAMDIAAAIPGEEPEPIIIDINHPFLFLIRDADNGTIWFSGTVYEPNLWSNDSALYEPQRY